MYSIHRSGTVLIRIYLIACSKISINIAGQLDRSMLKPSSHQLHVCLNFNRFVVFDASYMPSSFDTPLIEH